MTRPAHTPAMGDELKPCPFCGAKLRGGHVTEKAIGDAEALWWHPGVVRDGDCLLSGKGYWQSQLPIWNTRTETQSQATIDELVMLLGRLCDAYELVCSDAGKNYHQSQSSVYAHCRHAIAKAGGQSCL